MKRDDILGGGRALSAQNLEGITMTESLDIAPDSRRNEKSLRGCVCTEEQRSQSGIEKTKSELRRRRELRRVAVAAAIRCHWFCLNDSRALILYSDPSA